MSRRRSIAWNAEREPFFAYDRQTGLLLARNRWGESSYLLAWNFELEPFSRVYCDLAQGVFMAWNWRGRGLHLTPTMEWASRSRFRVWQANWLWYVSAWNRLGEHWALLTTCIIKWNKFFTWILLRIWLKSKILGKNMQIYVWYLRKFGDIKKCLNCNLWSFINYPYTRWARARRYSWPSCAKSCQTQTYTRVCHATLGP